MDKWPVVGIILVLVGLGILLFMSGFIVTILVTLIKLVAVFAGIILVLIGLAMIFGRRYMRRPRGAWGPGPAST